MKIFNDFKAFISRGNVMDMAVGVIMGTAFTKIINTLVASVITPAISLLTGKVNIAEMAYVVNENVSIAYGAFIQAIIDFLLIAICVFIFVNIATKTREKFEKKKEEEPEEVPAPSEEVLLLTEIRDLLKK